MLARTPDTCKCCWCSPNSACPIHHHIVKVSVDDISSNYGTSDAQPRNFIRQAVTLPVYNTQLAGAAGTCTASAGSQQTGDMLPRSMIVIAMIPTVPQEQKSSMALLHLRYRAAD